MNYLLHIVIMISIYAVLCLSANLLTGLTNKISMGFAAFYGLGAYITALCVLVLGWSMVPSILLILLCNTLLALVIALPSLRLKGDYFILATLGFQIIVFNVLYNWTNVTRGAFGIAGISNPIVIGGVHLNSTVSFCIAGLLLIVLIAAVSHRIIHSPLGRLLKALKDDEISLLSLGRNVNYYKTLAFVMSAAFSGVAGYIFATYISYIDPTSFTLDESIFILSALLIGGTGNLKGPLLGAVFVVVLPELLRFVGFPDAVAAPLKQIMYGVALILAMFYRKQGIAGENRLA